MQCKVVCPQCGDITKTYSIKNFRHCGAQYGVEANLLAGEEAKYAKMVKKYGKEVEPAKTPKVEDKKPVEEIVKKVEEKRNDTPVVAPIIEEKPEPPIEKKVRRNRRFLMKRNLVLDFSKRKNGSNARPLHLLLLWQNCKKN
jgi:hypothetical protein